MTSQPGTRLSRREFTRESALALLSGVSIIVSGCGDSGSSYSTPAAPSQPAASPPTGTNGEIMGVISANHGHIATITMEEIAAGMELTLDIDGDAGHPHMVRLSPEELTQIGNGVQVIKTASTFREDPLYPEIGTHTHNVTFN